MAKTLHQHIRAWIKEWVDPIWQKNAMSDYETHIKSLERQLPWVMMFTKRGTFYFYHSYHHLVSKLGEHNHLWGYNSEFDLATWDGTTFAKKTVEQVMEDYHVKTTNETV